MLKTYSTLFVLASMDDELFSDIVKHVQRCFSFFLFFRLTNDAWTDEKCEDRLTNKKGSIEVKGAINSRQTATKSDRITKNKRNIAGPCFIYCSKSENRPPFSLLVTTIVAFPPLTEIVTFRCHLDMTIRRSNCAAAPARIIGWSHDASKHGER
jgi:hypothetical protein